MAAMALAALAPGARAGAADGAGAAGECGGRLGAITPLCVASAPEDLEVLPGGRALLLSEYGGLEGGPGRLAVLDRQTRSARPLYPRGRIAGERRWGDGACPGEPGPELSPHGMHLARRADGALQLLVVNHGGRESVELFELQGEGASLALAWRGCVIAGPDESLNDVVALGDNGFLATMMSRRSDLQAMDKVLRGEATGYVLRWHPQQGWSRLPGSEGSLPNGIQASGDGRHAFVAYIGSSRVRKFSLPEGRLVGSASTAHPDNLTWTADGRLLAAGPDVAGERLAACWRGDPQACYVPSHVDEIDPATLQVRTLFRYDAREMLPPSVAVRVDDTLYVGSWGGDRLLEVALEP